VATIQGFTVRHEVIDDVIEAVKVLQAHPRIDRRRIFVLGHSLGGLLIPRIAAAARGAAGFIVMAGPARPVEEAIVAQTRYIVSADGTITAEEQKAVDDAVALAASVRALGPSDLTENRVLRGAPASYWLDLRGYDGPAAAKAVTAPMLILQGERDYQVTVEEFERWKAALGTRTNVTFHSYPALNHLFIAGTGPSLPDEYQTTGHVAADVIRDVAAWILAVR
jgi:alpha-beta hydrolase superfamily lysophospholipase